MLCCLYLEIPNNFSFDLVFWAEVWWNNGCPGSWAAERLAWLLGTGILLEGGWRQAWGFHEEGWPDRTWAQNGSQNGAVVAEAAADSRISDGSSGGTCHSSKRAVELHVAALRICPSVPQTPDPFPIAAVHMRTLWLQHQDSSCRHSGNKLCQQITAK